MYNEYWMDKMNKHSHPCAYIGQGQGCDGLAAADSSYCAEHYSLIYQVGTARRRRRRDIRRADAVWDIQSAFNEVVAELEAEGFDCYGRTDP